MSDDAKVVVSAPSGSTELRLPWTATVGQLFEQARSQLGLTNSRDYELWCADGVTMMNKLERTLQELRDRRICPTREFAIRQIRPEPD
ncbi:MAG: hypothetical protein PVSMB3_18800 [Candidatus Dormibacteraceae bacterium]